MPSRKRGLLAACAVGALSLGAVTSLTLVPAATGPYDQIVREGQHHAVVWAYSVADNSSGDTLTGLSLQITGTPSTGAFGIGEIWVVGTATPFSCNRAPVLTFWATPGPPDSFSVSGLSAPVKNGDRIVVGVQLFLGVSYLTPSTTPIPFNFSVPTGGIVFSSAGPLPASGSLDGPTLGLVSSMILNSPGDLYLDKNIFQKGERVQIRAETSLLSSTLKADDIVVRVYDLTGALVRTVQECSVSTNIGGEVIAYWDGRGDEGRFLGSGQYYIAIEFLSNDKGLVNVKASARPKHYRKKVGFYH